MTGVDDGPRPTLLRRMASGLGDLVGEAVGEFVVAVVSCAVFGLVVAAGVWGWHRHPVVTGLSAGLLVGLVGYGAWSLRPQVRARRARLASIAAVACGVVLVWLVYVLAHCTCT